MIGLAGNRDNTRGGGTSTNKNNKPKNHTLNNIKLTAEELSLPPIMRPLLYEDFKN
jgi:hypothetical protein